MGQQKNFLGIGRLNEKLTGPKIKLNNSKLTHNYMLPLFKDSKREMILAIYLTKRNHLIRAYLLEGETQHVTIDSHMIFQKAIVLKAKGIILIHNHPSGDPFPSDEDIETTNRFRIMSKAIRIRFVDHLIVTDKHYYSFFDNGKL